MHLGDIFFLLYPLTSSYASIILSCITLLGTNAYWLSSMTVHITSPSLAVRILDITLYMVVQHEIGIMSLIVLASDDWGIEVIKEQLTALYILLMLKNSCTASITSFLINSQDCLNKEELKPSIPGALVFPILCTIFHISFFVIGCISRDGNR